MYIVYPAKSTWNLQTGIQNCVTQQKNMLNNSTVNSQQLSCLPVQFCRHSTAGSSDRGCTSGLVSEDAHCSQTMPRTAVSALPSTDGNGADRLASFLHTCPHSPGLPWSSPHSGRLGYSAAGSCLSSHCGHTHTEDNRQPPLQEPYMANNMAPPHSDRGTVSHKWPPPLHHLGNTTASLYTVLTPLSSYNTDSLPLPPPSVHSRPHSYTPPPPLCPHNTFLVPHTTISLPPPPLHTYCRLSLPPHLHTAVNSRSLAPPHSRRNTGAVL